MPSSDPPQSPSLQWLLSQSITGMQLGLERISLLLKKLGHPEHRYPILHIAGTNGKGSVTAITTSLLTSAGLRVGSYTSPHLVELRERIAINGHPISSEQLEKKCQEVKKLLQETTPTSKTTKILEAAKPPQLNASFFELMTAIALAIFAEQHCDVVVLETGLGGRLDATNATPKIASAITSIGKDHTKFLGNTLDAIAREKAGIFRPNIPAFSVPQHPEVTAALQEVAARQKTPLSFIESPLFSSFSLPLKGEHQRWNAALALALIEGAGWHLSSKTIQEGLNNVLWPGRFQQLSLANSNYPLILDGAHNQAAIEALLSTWRAHFGTQKAILLFGALEEKEPSSMLEQLLPIAATTYLISPPSERAFSAQKLQKKFPQSIVIESLATLWPQLSELAEKEELPILLTGSLYLVGEALQLLEKNY